MRNIRIVTVGRLKGGFSYLKPGIDEYVKRLRPYCPVSIVEVADEPISPTRTPEQVMAREGERILPLIEKSGLAVALSERGKAYDSQAFADEWQIRMANPPSGGMATQASETMIFIVGGPLGLSSEVLARCHWVVSLSPMTFPHPMVRLILLEQLYRAVKIQHGEPYHK